MGTNARDVGPFVLSVAAELRAELARQHLTVTAVSALSGIPVSTLNKSLNGKRMIDVEELAKICTALLIQPAEIFTRAAGTQARVTPIRDVGGYLDDAVHGLDTAAGTDETQADEDD